MKTVSSERVCICIYNFSVIIRGLWLPRVFFLLTPLFRFTSWLFSLKGFRYYFRCTQPRWRRRVYYRLSEELILLKMISRYVWKKNPVMKNDSPLSFVRWVPCRSQIVPGLFNFDTTTPCPCVKLNDPINTHARWHTLKVEIEAVRITYFGSTGLQCVLFSFFCQSW